MQPQTNLIVWSCVVVVLCSTMCWLGSLLVWANVARSWVILNTKTGQLLMRMKTDPMKVASEAYSAILILEKERNRGN